MKTHIKAIQLDLTPSLKTYVDQKLGALERYVRRFEKDGACEMYVEVSRTTRHHHKGDVYQAKADILLPGHILRAEHTSGDVRTAIDEVRSTLRIEIRRHKDKILKRRERA